jgi:acetate kinase
MRVLAVNLGSSSLRLSVVDAGDRVDDEAHAAGDGDPIHTLREFVARVGDVDAVAHRLVHGGPSVRAATVVDDAVRLRLDEAAAMAPLHVPPALRLLDDARASIDRPQVVCVDTAFHAQMPEAATTYAIPRQWREWGVRRYGFHGLSYAWSSRRSAELLERPVEELQLLIAHVGAGVSACAVRAGRSVDTTMGFTPVEGAVMAMRSGSVDPGALLWLQQVHGVTPSEMNTGLEHRSGLLALAGSADVQELERRAAHGEAGCAAALEVYVHSLSRVIAGLAASLDRLDALVFTGGVGEHSAQVRTAVCRRLALLGVPSALTDATADAVISHPADAPAVVVVTAREDVQMARETRQVLGA